MITASMVEQELQQARAIRIAAEAACGDVEEMLDDIERSRPHWDYLTYATSAQRELLPLAA